MDNGTLVSAIIPVYNCDRYLAEAIQSVLAQTHRPIEVIVVDDGSTDGSADVARGFATVQYCFQPRSGAGAARNRGVELAQGSFFGLLDADDLWLKDKLTYQMAAFDSDAELDMVFGHIIQFHSAELNTHLKAKGDHDGKIMPGYCAGTILIKRESFFRVGPFATNWRVGEFVDWYLRAMERGLESFMLPDVVTRRRLHTDNMGIRERDSQTDYLRILKASLDRRRKMNLCE